MASPIELRECQCAGGWRANNLIAISQNRPYIYSISKPCCALQTGRSSVLIGQGDPAVWANIASVITNKSRHSQS